VTDGDQDEPRPLPEQTRLTRQGSRPLPLDEPHNSALPAHSSEHDRVGRAPVRRRLLQDAIVSGGGVYYRFLGALLAIELPPVVLALIIKG
jgi:hypothetical protein